MSERISPALRQQVAERAAHCCEYCRYPQRAAFLSFAVDHIIARKHGGVTAPENLALACPFCNRAKGTDLASLDPLDGSLTPFFNPRTQRWSDHFQLIDAELVPLTAIGRVTIRIFQINHPDRIAERRLLISAGVYPVSLSEFSPGATAQEAESGLDPLTVGELISLQEAANYAGLSKNSLLVYIRNQRLRARKLGSQWVTTRAAVDAYLASRDLESVPKRYRDPS
jgi:excisionase family DNA binding protein